MRGLGERGGLGREEAGWVCGGGGKVGYGVVGYGGRRARGRGGAEI